MIVKDLSALSSKNKPGLDGKRYPAAVLIDKRRQFLFGVAEQFLVFYLVDLYLL